MPSSPASPREIEALTRAMIRIPSVTLSRNAVGEYAENDMARFIESYFADARIATERIPLADGRFGIGAYLPGQSLETIVLSTHFDTVDVADYGTDDPFDPDSLQARFQDERFLYGRGALDMKSGLAVAMTTVLTLSETTDRQRGVIFLAVPDEENASAGIIAAGHYLAALKSAHKLDFVGNLNFDYHSGPDPDRTNYTLYTGVIGKLLPSFLVVGRDSHVSEAFNGLSANRIAAEIIRRLESNPAYSERVEATGEMTSPPSCLKSEDLKDAYSVQTPHKAWLYFNYLTYEKSPTTVLAEMQSLAGEALAEVVQENQEYWQNYCEQQGSVVVDRPWLDRAGQVITFDALFDQLRAQHPTVELEIRRIIEALSGEDERVVNRAVVSHLTDLADLPTPYVVCLFSPPFYPSASSENGFVQEVKSQVADFAREQNVEISQKAYYPYISDISFLAKTSQDVTAAAEYRANNPVFDHAPPFDPELIAQIAMPVINLGSYGYDAHRHTERVDRAWTFQHLPELVRRLIL